MIGRREFFTELDSDVRGSIKFGDASGVDSWFEHQNQGQCFVDLHLKITTMFSWCVPQNQVGEGLSVCASKPMSG
jgi:hypothetical protein